MVLGLVSIILSRPDFFVNSIFLVSGILKLNSLYFLFNNDIPYSDLNINKESQS